MLKTLNPLSKLAVCVLWLASSVLIFDGWFQIATIVVVWVTLVAINRTSLQLLLLLMLPFSLFGFGFLTTSVLFGRESDFAQAISGETTLRSNAFPAGIILFLRAMACGMVSTFFALTTDPGGLVRALMRYAKLPPKIGYSLFAAMQLVPDLASEAQQMRLARAMKSGRQQGPFPWPAELFSLIVPLLAFAIRRAGRTAIAMESRGLSTGPRTIINVPHFSRRDVAFATLSLGLCAICAYTAVLA
jgi:energy-coupling factor transport system permease protein